MIDQQARERAFKARAGAQAQVPTPQHAAAAAANEYAGDVEEDAEARRRRSRVQHVVDPPPEVVPEVVPADLGKRYTQAYDTPSGYPQPGRVSPEDFRRGPVTGDHAAYSPGYAPDARPVPVPSAAVSAAAISRPLLTDGRARPGAEG